MKLTHSKQHLNPKMNPFCTMKPNSNLPPAAGIRHNSTLSRRMECRLGCGDARLHPNFRMSAKVELGLHYSQACHFFRISHCFQHRSKQLQLTPRPTASPGHRHSKPPRLESVPVADWRAGRSIGHALANQLSKLSGGDSIGRVGGELLFLACRQFAQRSIARLERLSLEASNRAWVEHNARHAEGSAESYRDSTATNTLLPLRFTRNNTAPRLAAETAA